MKTTIANSVAKVLFLCIVSLFLPAPTGRAAGTVVAWGDNFSGQTNIPANLTDLVEIAAGRSHSLAVRSDGSVVGWGFNDYGQRDVPLNVTNVVGIAANETFSLAVTIDGRVIGWGNNESGQSIPPVGLTNVVAVAAGWSHSLALRNDGTVVGWGTTSVPAGLSDVMAIAAGGAGSMALKSDGTLVVWGDQPAVPGGLNNVVAIAAGIGGSIALKADGTVVTWGSQPAAPPSLSNVVAIEAGEAYSLALKNDGKVVAWGSRASVTNVPAGLANVVKIEAGGRYGLALVGDGRPFIFGPPGGRAYIGETVAFRVSAAAPRPVYYQWRKSGVDRAMQTNATLAIDNVQFTDAGGYTVLLTNSFGAVTSQVARLTVVNYGTPDIRADGVTLIEDAIRGDQSTISISTVFPNGTIFYTTDGSAPDFASEPYQGPFVIAQSTAIRAIAYSVDFTESAEDGPFQIQIVPTYALARSVMGQGVIMPFPNLSRYTSGATVALRGFEAPGWRFVRWQGGACGAATDGAIVVMDTNKTVTAVFEAIPEYQLTVTTAGGGTTSGNTGSPFAEGSVVNLTAQTTGGWQFLGWQGDASGTTPNLSVAMDRAKSIRAVFGTSMNTTVGGQGNLTRIPAQGPYPYGSTVPISASPNGGSYFAVWGSAASGRTNPLAFVVTNANASISALFAPLQGSDVNVYANVEGEGTVSASPNLQPYSPGTPVMLTATPSPGWRFVEWQGDASGSSTNTTVVLNVNKTVTAVFQVLPRYILATTTPGGGTISGNPSSSYGEGDVVNLTAQPASGWQFLGWQGDASGTTPNVTVTMDRAKNVLAVFATSLITNVVGSGTVTLSPAQGPYPYGSTVRLTATPNSGLYFNLWGNSANSMENPLDYVVTTANPAICALFGPTGTSQSPTITEQPISQSVIASGTATFHVTAAGTSPLLYQWRKEGTPIIGAMASTYALFGVSTNDAGLFDVVVANSFGSITSAVATLTVVFPPSITVQPASTVVASGNMATLSVAAGGTEPYGYQWHNSAGPIPDATNAIYTLDPALTNHAGNYVVVVSNPYGVVTSQVATLTVYVPVTVTSQPAQQVVPFRGTASFGVTANGYPAPSYQWLFNGEFLTGANSSSLVISNVGTNSLGGYSVIAWNAYSAATSSVARLLMSPSIRSPFLGATVVWGKTATLSASAVGSGELSYQWLKDGAPILWGTNSTLEFSAVQLSDAGLYSVVVSSVWGSVTNTPAQLVVNPANISLAMYAGITIDGVAGYTYGIQYTTDLRNTNAWVTITNVTLAVPVETWIDLESAGKIKRFYRVTAP